MCLEIRHEAFFSFSDPGLEIDCAVYNAATLILNTDLMGYFREFQNRDIQNANSSDLILVVNYDFPFPVERVPTQFCSQLWEIRKAARNQQPVSLWNALHVVCA